MCLSQCSLLSCVDCLEIVKPSIYLEQYVKRGFVFIILSLEMQRITISPNYLYHYYYYWYFYAGKGKNNFLSIKAIWLVPLC